MHINRIISHKVTSVEKMGNELKGWFTYHFERLKSLQLDSFCMHRVLVAGKDEGFRTFHFFGVMLEQSANFKVVLLSFPLVFCEKVKWATDLKWISILPNWPNKL